MGIYKSYKHRFQLKNANKIRLEKHQKNLLLQEQSASLNKVSTNEAATNEVSTNEAATNEVSTERNLLTLMIHKLPENDILPATNLISIINIRKKKNKKLHQKNTALVRQTQSLGAKAQRLQGQKLNHIAEIHSLVHCSKQITNEEFRDKVKLIFKPNSKSYSSNMIWLATNILQVGQASLRSTAEYMRLIYEFLTGEPPQNFLSTSTLRTWHQDISELHFSRQITQVMNAPVFGVMIDESQELKTDIRNGITDTFGLCELLLENNNFFKEFEKFCADDNLLVYNFPELYNFIKTQIYFIIVHQQQVEGLFNKLDLKTHSNMVLSVKQSKLQLSSGKIGKENLLEGLKEIRVNPKKTPLQETQASLFGPNIAANLFNNLLC
ncbi:30984_t:CDS:2 [Gigaspora margarita]|uniref:30984_t:CDS:1 n=1 Tax=Gigaspora margarita TaxID=4874 RepID=A0ABN7VP49_GIGMA|nr:30984_t:CDS:2 [Gigaspora margarita]